MCYKHSTLPATHRWSAMPGRMDGPRQQRLRLWRRMRDCLSSVGWRGYLQGPFTIVDVDVFKGHSQLGLHQEWHVMKDSGLDFLLAMFWLTWINSTTFLWEEFRCVHEKHRSSALTTLGFRALWFRIFVEVKHRGCWCLVMLQPNHSFEGFLHRHSHLCFMLE